MSGHNQLVTNCYN